MTPEQVAEYLQLTTDTVYRLIRQRRLAATRIGRSYRIQAMHLKDFLLANSTWDQVRAASFQRMMAAGKRNPDMDGDTLPEGVARLDEEQRHAAPEDADRGSAWLTQLYDQFAPVRDEAMGYNEQEINAAIDDAVRAARKRHA